MHRKSSLSLQAALPDGMTGNNFKTTDLFFIVPIPVGFSVSGRFLGCLHSNSTTSEYCLFFNQHVEEALLWCSG